MSVDDLLSLAGVTKLQPPQELAVKAGLLFEERPNLVVASPTGSGKTLIGEMAMLHEIQGYGRKAVYLVPLRALASEKGRAFRKYTDKLGLKVAVRTGDYDSDEIELKDQNIIIATYEKWDSIIRHKPAWLSEVGIVVADEGHQITDAERGPTIEIMLTRMMQKKVRILLLSAVMPNVESVSLWLSGKAVKSNWRSTKLDIGFFALDIIHGEDCADSDLPYLTWNCRSNGCKPSNTGLLKFTGDGKSKTKRLVDVDDPVGSLVYDALKSGGQSIVFLFQQRKNTQSSARKLCGLTSNLLTVGDRDKLGKLRTRLKSKSTSDEDSDTKTSEVLDYCLSSGVAFHHAGMSESLRDIVEDGFRQSAVKVIVCTPTLASGVNLPARRVIIQSIERYNAKAGQWDDIPHWEFLNMAGRAGRPDYDSFGEAIAICKPKTDPDHVEEYVSAGSEEIESKLTAGPSLYSHVLSEICLSNPTRVDLTRFLMQTFAAQNEGQRESILEALPKAIEFLTGNDLAILPNDGKLRPTALGDRVSRLYINPFSVPILIEGLTCKSPRPSTEGLLHLICSTNDWPRIIKSADAPITIDEGSILLEEEESEEALQNASFLHQYIEELDAEELYEQFNVGEADLHSAKDRAEWLLYSAREIARIIGLDRNVLAEIDKLRRRLKKGVKEELLDLTTIKGIARVRARRLFDAGIKTKEEYVKTNPENVRQIIFPKRELKQKGGLEAFF